MVQSCLHLLKKLITGLETARRTFSQQGSESCWNRCWHNGASQHEKDKATTPFQNQVHQQGRCCINTRNAHKAAAWFIAPGLSVQQCCSTGNVNISTRQVLYIFSCWHFKNRSLSIFYKYYSFGTEEAKD